MTYNEMVQALGWRLGDRSDMGPRIMAEAPLIQAMTLEGKPWQPWFLAKDSSGLTTVAGQRTVALPADFLGEIEDEALYIVNAAGEEIPLDKCENDVLKARFPGDGFPQAYSMDGTAFRLYPRPDDAWQLRTRYMGRAGSMLPPDDTTCVWLIHASDVVMAEIGVVIAGQHLRDMEMKANFEQAAAAAWNRVYQKHVAMAESNQDRAMGGHD